MAVASIPNVLDDDLTYLDYEQEDWNIFKSRAQKILWKWELYAHRNPKTNPSSVIQKCADEIYETTGLASDNFKC